MSTCNRSTSSFPTPSHARIITASNSIHQEPAMASVFVGTPPFRYRAEESWPSFPAAGSAGEAVGVACDSKDRVYVFARGPQPVQVFEPDGTPVTTWGEGQFKRPHG